MFLLISNNQDPEHLFPEDLQRTSAAAAASVLKIAQHRVEIAAPGV